MTKKGMGGKTSWFETDGAQKNRQTQSRRLREGWTGTTRPKSRRRKAKSAIQELERDIRSFQRELTDVGEEFDRRQLALDLVEKVIRMMAAGKPDLQYMTALRDTVKGVMHEVDGELVVLEERIDRSQKALKTARATRKRLLPK